jgi:endogenous inhibitor of DNA gyrase (YacG/DUF329 family)
VPHRRCPTCRAHLKDAHPASLGPFCSPRCRAADLGGWFDERFRVPDESGRFDAGDESEDVSA